MVCAIGAAPTPLVKESVPALTDYRRAFALFVSFTASFLKVSAQGRVQEVLGRDLILPTPSHRRPPFPASLCSPQNTAVALRF